jgi:tRNA(fMet)-specific endonuclease VapC
MWLFDTTYIIDLLRHDRKALDKAEDVDKSMAPKSISTITVHEVLRGIYYLYEGKKRSEKLKLTELALNKFDVISYTYRVAKKAAEIDAYLVKRGEMITFPDVVIAAIALTYDLILVTNDGHFRRIEGLKVEGY